MASQPITKAQFLKDIFIKACENLNSGIIEPYLNEDDVIYGKNKWEFLAYLRDILLELDDRETIKIVPIKRYCLKCHPNQEIIEFYSKESTPEYYRYLPKGKILKPAFAFAFPKSKDGKFEVERCHGSNGFQPGGTVKEREDVKRQVYGYFG